MTNITTNLTTIHTTLAALSGEFEACLSVLPARLHAYADAEASGEPEALVALFGAFAAAEGIATKEGYLAHREQVREALRMAETLQRMRRKAELALCAKGGMRAERERIYLGRMGSRRSITALIALRHAGKAWSRKASAEASASAA